MGNDGENLCKKEGLIFIKLSIENSEDLVTQINKSLYELIENYYYPNEEDRQIKEIRGEYEEESTGREQGKGKKDAGKE